MKANKNSKSLQTNTNYCVGHNGPHRGDGETTDWENYGCNYHTAHNIIRKKENENKNSMLRKNDKVRPSCKQGKGVEGNERPFPFQRKMNVSGCWFPYFGRDGDVKGSEGKRDGDHFVIASSPAPAPAPSTNPLSSLGTKIPRGVKEQHMLCCSATSGRTRILQDLLQCVLCWDVFVEATTAGCGHTFCASCLNDWKRKKKWCPVCQKIIQINIRSLNLDQIVEHFLPDLPIQSQERVRAAQRARLVRMESQLERKQILAQSFLGRICLRFWPNYSSIKPKTKPDRAFRITGNKGIFGSVTKSVYKMHEFLARNAEYHRLENVGFLVLSPAGLLLVGALMGCFLAVSSEFWSSVFQWCDSTLENWWGLKRIGGKGCSKEHCSYNRHF